MTATRISRVATLAVAALLWVLIASLLWRTKVPADLHLPQLDARAVFGAGAVRAGVRYERFLDYAWLVGTVAKVLALVVLVRRGPRLARSLGLGPVNAGLITGVFVMTVLWAVSLPFAVATGWWERRHGLSKEDWGTIVFSPWQGLLTGTFATVEDDRSEEHTSELQSRPHLVCRLLLEKKKTVSLPRFCQRVAALSHTRG